MNLEEVAAHLGHSVEWIGQQVYHLAKTIEEKGNQGYTLHHLRDDESLWLRLLFDASGDASEKYEAAYKGILFYRHARRKKERSGWQVRKNPHWSYAWAALYGWHTEQGQQALAQAHEQAIKDHETWEEVEERKRLNRPENFELGPYDDYSDSELIYLSEALGILEGRYTLKWIKQRDRGAGVNIWRMLKNMVSDAQSRIERELFCRHHTLPDIIEPDTPFSHSPRYDVFSHEYRQEAMHGEKEPELLRPKKEEGAT